MTKNIAFKYVNQETALGTLPLTPLVIEGLEDFKGSFDRLCLRAGTAAIEAMLAGDVALLCGQRYERHGGRAAHRWGVTMSEIDYHGGKAAVRRPRVRERRGAELELASWQAIKGADLLSRWAFNQMLIGVATRKYARSVRLPDGDLAGQAKRATSPGRAVVGAIVSATPRTSPQLDRRRRPHQRRLPRSPRSGIRNSPKRNRRQRSTRAAAAARSPRSGIRNSPKRNRRQRSTRAAAAARSPPRVRA